MGRRRAIHFRCCTTNNICLSLFEVLLEKMFNRGCGLMSGILFCSLIFLKGGQSKRSKPAITWITTKLNLDFTKKYTGIQYLYR
jgi:hypothetical protein